MPVYRWTGTTLVRLDVPQAAQPTSNGVLSKLSMVPSASSVALSWDYAGGALTQLRLTRGATVVATLSPDVRGYTDLGVAANTSYTYSLTGTMTDPSATLNTVTVTVKTLAVTETPASPARFTDTNKPWALLPGETLRDNIPAGVPVVNASAYSSSTDLFTVLEAVRAGISVPSYVVLDSKPRYFISDLKSYGTNDWRGWTNGDRKIMGLIGLGVTQTSITVAPNAVSSSAGARDYILASDKSMGPTPVSALYFSNTSTTVPMFFSGISFDGQLQTPYGTYSASAQAQFDRNQTVASPLGWRGIQLWRGITGSRMQYCRFQGFAYSLLNAPSFEHGLVETNYSDGLVFHRNEFDGRIAAEFDSTRHLASGGVMWNKDIKVTVQNSWLHHTRRSGWATNTNTGLTTESYNGINFQIHDITGLDEFASVSSGFSASNVEGVVGTFTYTDMYANITPSNHITLNIPYSGTPGVYTLPDRPIVVVKNWRTDDTLYGGCLRVAVSKTPNSTGTNPVWTKLTNLGIAGANVFDVRRADGTALTGIKSTAFNASLHKPDTHYVVIY